MFHRRREEFGIVPVRIEELHTLFLAQRIPRETNISPARQRSEHLLPREMRFTTQLMPQWKQDGRIRRRAFFRQVEIRRHIKVRLALKNNLLDLVIAPVQRSGDMGVEWRALGQSA